MKRFHVHVGVQDLQESIRFYSGLFGAPPTVHENDYAKWMLEDPRINFAISKRGTHLGVDHLGLQVDTSEELPDIRERFAAADQTSLSDELGVECCYAKSDKHWVTDPQGVTWEGWHSLGQVEIRNAGGTGERGEAACCAPATAASTALPRSTAKCCS